MFIQIQYSPLDRTSASEEYTEQQLDDLEAAVKASVLESVRARRNQLLTESDWINNPDAPLSEEQKQSWLQYRQALRDFPESVSFDSAFALNDLSFPQKPE
jgi:hypothetical protein